MNINREQIPGQARDDRLLARNDRATDQACLIPTDLAI